MSKNDSPTRSDKGTRNTGYQFDLLDRDRATRGENGLLEDFMAQMGNYDTRHEAIGMKVIIENRFPEYDYEIRAFETMWRQCDEPVVCGWCGFETWYRPLVNWTFVADCSDSPFCSTECYARSMYADDPDWLRAATERDSV